ncbi:TPA: ParA family protein [Vibrio cholerae]|uniref:ParA family protein n=1 Tax=Vibrio cholerae TaxID=666 RepID=UPI0015FAAB5C|nr:ParA family protein [Vibrio cholerae]HAS6154404.1 AAA family ATPase [Vibrio vulnificus]EII3729055.1 ParA family protein [Vibrio cholerae]EJK2108179.1 ParA family protein [Vibrio cholerae]EKF9238238.1 ParA family protein [Vibrio cholerae]MBA8613038.1 ParA family protein [Vibrio cholerae]
MNLDKIVARQAAYYAHDAQQWNNSPYAVQFPHLSDLLDLKLPKHNRYAICNLRGGIGKSTLTFNLAFGAKDVLAIDTCPQGNSSNFFSSGKPVAGTTIYDALLPYLLPRMSFPSNIAQRVEHFNSYFDGLNAHFVPASPNLYEFPSIMESALSQARGIPGGADIKAREQILNSMRDLLDRETKKVETKKVIIDTSPFFSGATHLTWHAVDSLIVPVRTDQQSVDSLQLLIDLLTDTSRSFLRSQDRLALSSPKIQMVVVTHCGWSTRAGAKHEPNNQTKIYLEKVRKIVANNMHLFTTNDPDNHIVPLDDFLGSGRISSAKSIPIKCLKPQQSFTISGQQVTVNSSVEKCQKQLAFITQNIW